jgi:hypothetical protein
MAQGLVALSDFQFGLESVRGTEVDASRKIPLVGAFNEINEDVLPQEQRRSFEANYRNFQVKQFVQGQLTGSPTFERLPFLLKCAVRGDSSSDAVNSATTAYTYTFTPQPTADDLKTATIEFDAETAAYTATFGLLNRLELNWQAGAAPSLSMDWLAKSMTAKAKTSSLSDTTEEDVSMGVATVTIDASTIGSTTVTNVLEARFALENNWNQLWTANATITPSDAYRSTRKAALDLTVQFNDTVEMEAFRSSGRAGRKIRLALDGSIIAGSAGSLTRRVTIDWYGKWRTAVLSDQNGIYVLRCAGESIYESTAGASFKVTVRNGNLTVNT